MSMIARYKKKGGFLQLLNLIETCGPQKQESFLKIIGDEDYRWAEAVRNKLLTIKRIFSWNDNAVAELTATLKDLTLATAIAGLEVSTKEKIFKTMNHARKRKIEDLTEEKKPSGAEISTSFIQILTEVRKMIQDGMLALDKIDPDLLISSDFEDALLSGGPILKISHEPVHIEHHHPAEVQTPEAIIAGGNQKAELEHLRKTVTQLMMENQKLKERIVAAENKLSQIKKIA